MKCYNPCMLERETNFSEEESIEIAELARQAARVGEKCVDSITLARLKLTKVVLKAGPAGVVIEGKKYSPTEMRHEIELMDEVVKQARLILQFEGRDTLSELDRRAQDAGWGSVYDPESEIGRRLGFYNR